MRKYIIFLAGITFIFYAINAYAQNVSTGFSIADGQLNNFYLSIGDYYHVPKSQVIYFQSRYHMPNEELPVLFFLSSQTHLKPQVIIDLKESRKMSWLDITCHLGMPPQIYYVPATRERPPYGNAYGHYQKDLKHHKEGEFSDEDIVNLANLQFLSDYFSIAPTVIIKKRSKGENFIAMNDEYRKAKKQNGKNNTHTNNIGRNKVRS